MLNFFLGSNLKAQLDSTEGLLKELSKYEKEQEITFNMCNQKKSQAKHYKKKLLNEQQKQVLLHNSQNTFIYSYIWMYLLILLI